MPNPYHDKLGRFATKNGGYSAAHVPSGSRLAGRGPKVRPVTKAQRKEAGTGLYAPNRERTAAHRAQILFDRAMRGGDARFR